ncbi:integration host factor subunit beta [Acidithiobacillus ferrivorans]|nr:integration host factor subunit beta [Acidithiobacillus ferrivorans]
MVCKPELANLLVETHCASTKKVASTILDRLFGHITLEAFHGKKVRIHGFGTFSVKHKPANEARNPATGEAVNVPAKDVLVFKASK